MTIKEVTRELRRLGFVSVMLSPWPDGVGITASTYPQRYHQGHLRVELLRQDGESVFAAQRRAAEDLLALVREVLAMGHAAAVAEAYQRAEEALAQREGAGPPAAHVCTHPIRERVEGRG